MFQKYLNIIQKLKVQTTQPNIFVCNVIKLTCEIELNCSKQANKTFTQLIQFERPVELAWSLLVRDAFMIGKIDVLCDAYRRWKEYFLLDLGNDYNYLFFQYYKYKECNDVSQIHIEDFKCRKNLSGELKSIICFLISISMEKDEDKINYLEMAHLSYSKNYAVINEIIKWGKIPKNVKVQDILYNEIDNIKYIPYSSSIIENKDINANFQLCVLGGGNHIGGSCYLLKFNEINILVDYGAEFASNDELIYPHLSKLKDFGLNGIEDIDMFLVTHAHLDHAGAIVELYKSRPSIPIYMTEASKDLIQKNLCLYGEDRYYLNKCLNSAVDINFREPFVFRKDDRTITIEFFRAGHILGASSLYMQSQGIGVFVTGDYSLEDQKTVKGMDIPKGYKIDVLITESTYGSSVNYNLYPRKIEEKFFINHVREELMKENKVLIPAFALGRAQEIICLIKQYFKSESCIPFRVYVDGLVIDICKIYSKYANENFQGRGIFFSNDNQGYNSKEEFINNEILQHSSCIIASSGMIKDGSASSYYAEKLIEDEKASCILTGYQDGESAGGRLKNQISTVGDKYLQLNGNLYKVKFNVKEYYLSAHCNFEQIIELIFKTTPRCVFLVHGNVEEDEKSELYEKLSLVKGLKVIQTFNNKYYDIQKYGLGEVNKNER